MNSRLLLFVLFINIPGSNSFGILDWSQIFHTWENSENLACKQLMHYTNSSSQMEDCQSAYQEILSIETALLKVKADILDGINIKEVICLVMLDLSAAFVIVNLYLLLNILKYRFGVWDLVLPWLQSLSQKQNPMYHNPKCRWQYSRVLKKATFRGNTTRLHSWAHLVQHVCGPTG